MQAIIFDFDGVIADSEPLHYRAFLDVLRPLGFEFDYDAYRRRYIGFDDRDGFRAMAADHDITLNEQRIAALVEEKARVFERIAAAGVRPFPGVGELIERAADAMPIAIASGALRSDIEAILAGLGGGGLLGRFSAVITADDVRRSKPDPESYALAVRRLGMDPHAALAIEDTHAGLASARAAGLRTLAVSNTEPPDALSDAERIVNSLTEATLDRLRDWYR